jgi:hypothetical protein
MLMSGPDPEIGHLLAHLLSQHIYIGQLFFSVYIHSMSFTHCDDSTVGHFTFYIERFIDFIINLFFILESDCGRLHFTSIVINSGGRCGIMMESPSGDHVYILVLL